MRNRRAMVPNDNFYQTLGRTILFSNRTIRLTTPNILAIVFRYNLLSSVAIYGAGGEITR